MPGVGLRPSPPLVIMLWSSASWATATRVGAGLGAVRFAGAFTTALTFFARLACAARSLASWAAFLACFWAARSLHDSAAWIRHDVCFFEFVTGEYNMRGSQFLASRLIVPM